MLFYCSVHNVNYSIFKVNKVHSLHHKEVNVNFGPDVCDVLFGTKHYSENSVENTNHYVPNILIITGIVIILKNNLLLFVLTILSLGIILLFVSSIVLWYLECKKYNNKIENRLYKKNNSGSKNKDDIDIRERSLRKKDVSNVIHIEETNKQINQ